MPCGFVEFHFTTIDGFWNLLRCNHLRSQFSVAPVNLLLARHGCVHGTFQFSPRILKGILCIHRHPDQLSRFLSVVDHCRVLASRFSILVFLDSGRLSQFWSIRQATHDLWSRSRLNFCQSLSPDFINPLGGFSLNKANFVKPFHESDKLLFETTFQLSSIRFCCNTSRCE